MSPCLWPVCVQIRCFWSFWTLSATFLLTPWSGKLIFTHFSAISGHFLATLCDFQISLFWDLLICAVRCNEAVFSYHLPATDTHTTYTHKHTHTPTHIDTHARTHIHTHVHTHTNTHTHTCTLYNYSIFQFHKKDSDHVWWRHHFLPSFWTPLTFFLKTYPHINIHTHTHTQTHAYKHTHTHTVSVFTLLCGIK